MKNVYIKIIFYPILNSIFSMKGYIYIVNYVFRLNKQYTFKICHVKIIQS